MAFDEYAGAVFSPRWKTSERKYAYDVERDVKIPMSDGVKLSCDMRRPKGEGKFLRSSVSICVVDLKI